MSYAFDGPTKRIILDSTDAVDVADMYSRWKEWVADGHAQFEPAFRSVAGDPIGAGQTIAPYIFLNTPAGWRIRPAEVSHALRVIGNLYPDGAGDDCFTPPITPGLTVMTMVERSASAIAVSTGGGGGGLSGTQATQLAELYRMQGLDPTRPLVVTATERTAGAEIEQSIEEAPPGTVTVRRQ